MTNTRVESLDELPPTRVVLCDLTPRGLLHIAGDRLPPSSGRRLERFYGAGAFKIDWALDAPVPWRAKECLRAGTVHLGGTLSEIVVAERAPYQGSTRKSLSCFWRNRLFLMRPARLRASTRSEELEVRVSRTETRTSCSGASRHLSYRDLEEMMRERGTIYRPLRRFSAVKFC